MNVVRFKVLISFITSLCIGFSLHAQLPNFKLLIGSKRTIGVSNVHRTGDNGYLIGGRIINPETADFDLFIVKLNETLEQEWGKKIGSSLEEWYQGSAIDSEGNIYINAHSRSWGGVSGRISTNVLKLNSFGELLWSKSLDTVANFNRLHDLILIGDTALTITGTHTLYDNDLFGNGIFNTPIVVSLNKDGELNYRNLLQFPFEVNSRSMIANNGDVVIQSSAIETSLDGQSDTAREYITRLDSKGNIRWSKEYIFPNNEHVSLQFRTSPINFGGRYLWTSMDVQTSSVFDGNHLIALSVDVDQEGKLVRAYEMSSEKGVLGSVDQTWTRIQGDTAQIRYIITDKISNERVYYFAKSNSLLDIFDIRSYEIQGGSATRLYNSTDPENTFFSGIDFDDVMLGQVDYGNDCFFTGVDPSVAGIERVDISSDVIIKESNPKLLKTVAIQDLKIDGIEELEFSYLLETCQNSIVIEKGKDTIQACSGKELSVIAKGDNLYEWYDLEDSELPIAKGDSINLILEESKNIFVKGLSGSDTIHIKIEACPDAIDELLIYKKYSPNGDGKNECFAIKGLDKFEENALLIYNEIGQEVHHAENYKSGTYCFEGLSDGSYSFILTITNQKTFYGSIIIKR